MNDRHEYLGMNVMFVMKDVTEEDIKSAVRNVLGVQSLQHPGRFYEYLVSQPIDPYDEGPPSTTVIKYLPQFEVCGPFTESTPFWINRGGLDDSGTMEIAKRKLDSMMTDYRAHKGTMTGRFRIIRETVVKTEEELFNESI